MSLALTSIVSGRDTPGTRLAGLQKPVRIHGDTVRVWALDFGRTCDLLLC